MCQQARTYENPRELQPGELQFVISAISHDLRAPLRAIDAYMHLLAGELPGSTSDAAHRYIERAGRSVKLARTLVDDLLNFVRTGQGPIAKERIDLSALAKRIIAELQAIEPTHAVTAHIEPGLRTIGDPILIHRLLHNLLSNAWKFTRRKAAPTIRLYADFLDSCTFCIEDNGSGFDASEAKSLFLPFHRLNRATEEGYGMGLAISQRIIALHHGWIRAEGELGKGARFYFSLPCET